MILRSAGIIAASISLLGCDASSTEADIKGSLVGDCVASGIQELVTGPFGDANFYGAGPEFTRGTYNQLIALHGRLSSAARTAYDRLDESAKLIVRQNRPRFEQVGASVGRRYGDSVYLQQGAFARFEEAATRECMGLAIRR